MSPIRTAIIGLSKSSSPNWASYAHLPYLLSAEGRAKYQIVALCNSSVEAAKRSIETFQLPAETRAYGDPESLAADADVQLVLCATRVDRHYGTMMPSLRRGKSAFVEWPLAENAARAAEMAAAARENGGRTVVGFQGWYAPAVMKVREIVTSGRLGKVLSSEARGAGGTNDRTIMPSFMSFFTDSKIGSNPFSIGLGHLFDFVQVALGDVQVVNSHMQIQRPDVKIRDVTTGEITETLRSDVPDLMLVTGTLAASEHAVAGATVHVRVRRGQPFKGEDPLVWTVNCEKGEIRLSATGGMLISAFAHGQPVAIEVHDFETDEVQQVEWKWEERLDLDPCSRMVGALYEAFAAGDETKYATFDHAVKRHKQLDEMWSTFSP
ncbi:NAD(P)-binding protein [Hypoxylon sp. FL1284]|nr:NAD(P)-binding protein [Hypoxylon sp. FL1284]